ncbi:dihydrofolate reductase [Jeotgalibacillus sp. S-D1]|uniref:dihydrofolate reductase n=1 Tax=Jeotgalibacillus sp. S-D1 TaxID=2552189 RepID=UPI001059D254|nr:dihydrofolate reductase [Jeotgalibacillus sp. S-D1]TDL34801.1 dihydrofolate reductase [Jeotgalibacillus sp. S-D1]
MISIIVAHADNRVIGYQNDMPWHLPKDLAYFKEKTIGKTLLMGRKTFEAMNGPLKKRTNIVVTSNKQWNHEGAAVVYSLEEGIKMLQKKEEETFVIGGGKIYEAAMKYADRLYITVINLKTDGDTVFPDYHTSDWKEISSVKGIKDDKNPYDYYFKMYERANK